MYYYVILLFNDLINYRFRIVDFYYIMYYIFIYLYVYLYYCVEIIYKNVICYCNRQRIYKNYLRGRKYFFPFLFLHLILICVFAARIFMFYFLIQSIWNMFLNNYIYWRTDFRIYLFIIHLFAWGNFVTIRREWFALNGKLLDHSSWMYDIL